MNFSFNVFSERAVSVWRMISYEVLGKYKFDIILHQENLMQNWKETNMQDSMRAHDCTPAFLTILGWIASPGLALPCLRLAPGLALLASAGVAPGLAFKPHLPCLLPLLLVSPVLSGPPTPPPESPLSLPEKIFNKIGELVETEKKRENPPQWVGWGRVWFEQGTHVASQRSTARWKTSRSTLERLPGENYPDHKKTKR